MTKVFLCILDGFSIGDPDYEYNAVFKAKAPNIKRIIKDYPMSFIKTSGVSVGLPEGQMGNSEVGHMAIGSGRIIYQDLPKINNAINDKSIFNLHPIKRALTTLTQSKGSLHLTGLASDGGVHSHWQHMAAIANFFASSGVKVKLHPISDGRDVAPKSFLAYYNQTIKPQLNLSSGLIEISTISGRYYAMDRDNKAERTNLYYQTLAQKSTSSITNIEDQINNFYNEQVYDEFIKPFSHQNYTGFQNGDALIMTNFRPDRARQIFKLISTNQNLHLKIAMTPYYDKITEAQNTEVLFDKENISKTLGEILSSNNLTQLHTAETEKYAHVTFFLNGGREEPFKGEDRALVPSPKVATYDSMPEMSIKPLEQTVLNAIKSGKYNFIACNVANGDMVGHTGHFEASKQAVECIDSFLQNIEKECITNDYKLLITADHGNCEEMIDKLTGEAHTQHTLNPVPLIYIANDSNNYTIQNGTLCDIAPTILNLFNIPKPPEMTGKNLLILK